MALKRKGLKRALPSASQAVDVPELPKLSGGTLLQVFTHKSLRRADQDPFDNERFSLLGEKILRMLVTDVLLGQRPILMASELAAHQHFFSSSTIDLLVRHYGLLKYVRCPPNNLSILDAPEEAASILHAYIGGIHADHGIGPLRKIVQTWIQYSFVSYTPPLKKIKMESDTCKMELDSPPVVFLGHPDLPFLSLFNQTALQRGVLLDYPGTYDHLSRQWTVRCVVNGVPTGTGSDSSRNVATEQAARRAYGTMGWIL
ncbi:hypothetical protein K438DRAFT_1803653 [Mycena galopus ATCC 62051]|nr:hypothetical protein K438DRAFT_1803653 [Mycena galopus ATCC 62051]